MAGRSLAGSIAWPTSAPACHSSRAACPKSGWPQLPYSPVWARSSTEANWRRQRMPPPQPPWPPCHPAHLLRPPAHPPPCLVTLATSPAGRGCMACWETLGWTCYIGSQVTENLLQLMDLSTAKGPVRLILTHGRVSAKHLKKSWAVKCFFSCRRKELLLLTKTGNLWSSLSSIWDFNFFTSNMFSLFYLPNSFMCLPATSKLYQCFIYQWCWSSPKGYDLGLLRLMAVLKMSEDCYKN